MTGNIDGFDANKYEPVSFDTIEPGEYDAIIVDSVLVPTKAGDGRILKLTYQIVKGEHKNRKVFDQLNIINPNETAQTIARGMLSSICRAVGVLNPQDSSELHNKVVTIKVAVKPATDEFEARNVVKKVSSKSTVPKTGNTGFAETAETPW